MLGLLAPTDPSWVSSVEGELPRLLSDHAHCELKAAQSALAMVARFGGEAPNIVEPLLALAKEETTHFDQVHRELAERGERLELPAADEYVGAIQRAARKDHGKYPLMLDRLLISALIEGRSCERFRLLSETLSDEGLREFYRELMASEARHFRLFCRLAEDHFGLELTRERFAQLAEREAAVVNALPGSPKVHG